MSCTKCPFKLHYSSSQTLGFILVELVAPLQQYSGMLEQLCIRDGECIQHSASMECIGFFFASRDNDHNFINKEEHVILRFVCSLARSAVP